MNPNIDKEIQKFESSIGLIQVWKVWHVGGGQGYVVTIASSNRSNGKKIFSHVNKKRALSYASDFKDGANLGVEMGIAEVVEFLD